MASIIADLPICWQCFGKIECPLCANSGGSDEAELMHRCILGPAVIERLFRHLGTSTSTILMWGVN
jgi:hypothetical protein